PDTPADHGFATVRPPSPPASSLHDLQLELGASIGGGAFGKVYVSFWHGQVVAVKKWHRSDRTASILKEIDQNRALRHRHIIQFLGAGTVDGSIVMITDYAENGSLQRVIKMNGASGITLTWETKTRIRDEIASSLTYLHSLGILHRDLKSANILLTKHLEVRLCDFGLALDQRASETGGEPCRKQGAPAGTLRWMAPELLTEKPVHSASSDIYAFGMVMWEMASNRTKPFAHQENDTQLAAYVRSGGRETIPDDTPAEFRLWIDRCWDQDPANRPKAIEMAPNNVAKLEKLIGDGETKISDSGPSALEKNVWTPASQEDKNCTLALTFGTTLLPTCDSWDLLPTCKSLLSRSSEASLISTVDDEFEDECEGERAHVVPRAPHQPSTSTHLPQPSEKYVDYKRQAAEGDKQAQFKLGFWHLNGDHGLDLNYQEAHHWLSLAAQDPSGIAAASRLLSILHDQGLGVTKDPEKAFKFFLQAANQGDLHSQLELSSMYRIGNRIVSQNLLHAFDWMSRAAKSGSLLADYGLGWHYEQGYGVCKDLPKAMSLYICAAEKGHQQANTRLARLRQIGQDLDSSSEDDVDFFRTEAARGHVETHLRMEALYYRNGHFGTRDIFGSGLPEMDPVELLDLGQLHGDCGDPPAGQASPTIGPCELFQGFGHTWLWAKAPNST
ncbi:copper transport protein ctr1, partial [Actinomortierella ambigua]